MTKLGPVRFWIAAAALLLAVAGWVRAQEPASTPGTDVFASNSSTQVYEDQYSSKCSGSLAMDSPDPAVCFDLPARNGECSTIGGMNSTFAGKTGNNCHYCQQRPPGIVIVVPADAAGNAAYQQGFVCSANPSDGCYLTCYGGKKFTPPPGTTLMGQGGQSEPQAQPQSKPPIKLQGYISNAPDPCYPAGPKNYWVCDYPNLPRPPGCTCSQTVPKQPPQQAKQAQPKPTGMPSAQSTDQSPDPNNYPLGMMVGISTCIQSFPTLAKGMGYFMVGQFENAAAAWGVEPGQSMTLKELATPVTGSSVTPYQQGVIAGQRLCGYIAVPVALHGVTTVGKNLLGKGVPKSGGTGTPGGNHVEPSSTAETPPADRTVTSPTPSKPEWSGGNLPEDGPAGNPPSSKPNEPLGTSPEDRTVNNPPAEDRTVNSSPGGSEEPPPITGGESAQDPIEGNVLKGALTNDPKTNTSNARALGGKYVDLENGPVELGAYIDEGSYAGVYKNGATQVRKLAKNSGAGYFNEQLEGQSKGSDILKKLGIDHPQTSDFVEGGADWPASLLQETTTQKYPDSYELSSGGFQKMPRAQQAQVLGAIKNVIDKLAASGYIMGDINPANFTIVNEGGVLKAIIHDPDAIVTMQELDAGNSSAIPTLDCSLGASGAGPYSPGEYANAQALANKLYSGMSNWLHVGPPAK